MELILLLTFNIINTIAFIYALYRAYDLFKTLLTPIGYNDLPSVEYATEEYNKAFVEVKAHINPRDSIDLMIDEGTEVIEFIDEKKMYDKW